MRSLFLLAVVCCLVLSACGSPIARPEEVQTQEKEVGRQAPAAAAPAASDDDDDEDDDDDDDVDLDPLTDDDDDDDDDDDEDDPDEDDDEDDYLERFFDDILGGGEDDDDDDEPAPVQSVVAAADTVAAAPAAPAAPAAAAEDAAGAASEEVGEGAEAAADAAAEGDEPEAGQKEPASVEVENAAAAASSEVAAPAEAEDDEDDDDIADALDPEGDDDDDDDDDEEEDDDDDDDDDDITDALGRNHSVKQSRALAEEPPKKPPVPAVYIIKYNRFVDNILEKMNDVLRRSYDPVSVKLQPIDASKKTTKKKNTKKNNKTKKNKNKRKSSTKKKNSARGSVAEKLNDEPSIAVTEKINKIEETKPVEEKPVADPVQNETQSRALKEKGETGKAKPTTTKPKPPKPTKGTKPKPKPQVKATTKKPVTKNKTKTTTTQKSKPRAKGTLYGLSSLRRVGDVAVSIMTDHTTVKSNFAVGPLILRVEKEVGRGAKKEIKSATATTAEMTGKISLRVNNQGVATLHSIKVLQPKQVRVDSNHERTRELVWRRSARIAHVVSEKLLTVSKPMFQIVDKQ